MNYLSVFKMPNPVKITGRTSSITNAFINGIVPCITPTDEEIKLVLAILGMDISNVCCAYCGDKFTEWDHFRPLVHGKRATGYISEINNLVPSCGKCNQSKGNSNWKEWIKGAAPLSPSSRKIKDLDEKIRRLEEFEKWSNPIKLNFAEIVGAEKWEQHWRNCELLHEQMRISQQLSDEIKGKIEQSLVDSSLSSKKYNNAVVFSEEVAKIDIKKNESSSEPKNIDNKAIGIIVKTTFKDFLQSEKCDFTLIKFLQEKGYSKSNFNVDFPILVKVKNDNDIKEKRIDHLGRPRYYAKPFSIKGELYLLTTEWYDKSKEPLINWINSKLK